MATNMDFKELEADEAIKKKLTTMSQALDKIEEVFKFAEEKGFYEKLSNKQKIDFNILLSFSLNSLFWMYLRAEGIDPKKHKITSENDRVKSTLLRARELFKKDPLQPRIDTQVAKRFIKHSLWVPIENKNESINTNDGNETGTMDTSQTEENWD
ncbi:nuclear nucleic acid-binding protein C1D-like [Trichogramma pretiosum]|uniref:nuclear nucleic acid-binding protein C1D-like n=1 Tax=Trichogramma pretiosum TaxID=7493 RepID=UPI0006C9AE1C|nr:nuclear nucleic acid-binding protein C1D-like [Trichogramma pretiosum]XP_014223911.1 nuclear nucleic acid-binding protein C1D-like [Trichogramma pretiosum]